MAIPLRRDGLDPVPEIARARTSDPVARLTTIFGTTVWLVTGYDEVRAVLADTSSYSNDIRGLVGRNGATGPSAIGGLGFTDPPEHTRLRRLLTPEFTMRRLRRLEPQVEAVVNEQLDVVEASGPVVDLVPTFAFPVPFRVICDLLGLSLDDRESFRQLGHARFDATGGAAGLLGAMSESRSFLIDAAVRQRSQPGDGLLGALIREHGDAVDDVELGGLADGVFTGGYETSASMLGLGTLTLLQNPAALTLVRDDPAAVEPVVEELLRYLSVVQVAFPRFAREDMVLLGHRVRAGDVVVCSLSGANRDQAHGVDAEQFNPHRSATSHLAFGHGFHRCVGAELARMELRAAFRALARRLPTMRLAVEPSELSFHQVSFVYGLDSLPVRPFGQPQRLVNGPAQAPELGRHGATSGVLGETEAHPACPVVPAERHAGA